VWSTFAVTIRLLCTKFVEKSCQIESVNRFMHCGVIIGTKFTEKKKKKQVRFGCLQAAPNYHQTETDHWNDQTLI